MIRATVSLALVAAVVVPACGGGGEGATVTTLQSNAPAYSQTLTVSVSGFRLDGTALEMVVDGPCSNPRASGAATASQAAFACTVSGVEQGFIARIRESESGRELARLRIDPAPMPRVAITATDGTRTGTFTVELDPVKAPLTVDNFLAHVAGISPYYTGTIFHRVIKDFVIQGGGYTTSNERKSGARGPIRNEAGNGLKNLRGTIAMARTDDPDSATSEFFVNLVDNPQLDPGGNSAAGYAVFGKVVDGINVIDFIGGVPTRAQGIFENLPETAIRITAARQTR